MNRILLLLQQELEMKQIRLQTGEKIVVGNRIRNARNALGLTREQFGRRIGVPQSTIGFWERGLSLPCIHLASTRTMIEILGLGDIVDAFPEGERGSARGKKRCNNRVTKRVIEIVETLNREVNVVVTWELVIFVTKYAEIFEERRSDEAENPRDRREVSQIVFSFLKHQANSAEGLTLEQIKMFMKQ